MATNEFNLAKIVGETPKKKESTESVKKEEIKKMPWQETMTKLEDAVKVAQEKEERLNETTAEFNTAKQEYSEAVAAVEQYRTELSNTVGNLFQSNPRVTVSN